MKKSSLMVGAMILYVLGIILWYGKPEAATERTSYDVYTLPVMYLDEGIDETQTNGIILAAPKLNGTEITIQAMSGAIFEFRKPRKKEDIYASRVAVNSDNTVTLTGTIIRDLCQYTETRTFTTCDNGLTFGRGDEVRLTDNHRLFNLKADTDRANTFTALQTLASGATLSGSGYTFGLPRLTTTERDALVGVKDGDTIYNKTLVTAQVRAGGAWISFGSGTTVAATEAIAGKVELGTVADQLAKTITGDSGGATVLQSRYVTASGGSALAASRVPIMGANGLLTGSLLGTGTRDATTFLRGDQTYAVPKVFSGSNLIADQTVSSTITLTSTTFAAIDSSNLTVSPSLSVGDLLTINFRGAVRRSLDTVGNIVLDIQVGNNPISPFGSGALSINVDPNTDGDMVNASFTMFHRVLTGGTLTLRPVYRLTATAGGGPAVEFRPNTSFQVIKTH